MIYFLSQKTSEQNPSLRNNSDDNILNVSSQKLEEIKRSLHCDFKKVTKWFYENNMVFIQGKCYFMCLRRNTDNKSFVF